MIRIGHGYDAHRLADERTLTLGGVTIPFGTRGLDGHSDADVLLHALIDAVFGAAGMGDIGRHFPDSDTRYNGISSLLLLRETMRLAGEAGWKLVNADITMIAQAPKLSPYIDEMRRNVEGITAGSVNIKATTEEYMGFTGRTEGMACHAVVLLESI